MHLIDEDRFFDVTFSFWQNNGEGGGFAYTRRENYVWVTADLQQGSVLAGESQEIMLEADLTGVPAGVYEGSIVIQSNASENSNLEIPLTITVSGGVSDIELSTAAISFPTAVVNQATAPISVELINVGTGVLNVTDITSDNTVFSATPVSFTVLPGESQLIDVIATPKMVGLNSGQLTIVSDDPDPSTIDVDVNGQEAPEIVVSESSFEISVTAGQTGQATFTIENTAIGNLDYTVALRSQSTEEVTFEKLDGADPTLEVNQDRVANDIFITRGSNQGLFNIAIDEQYTGNVAGTQWSSNSTLNSSTSNSYDIWNNNACPNCVGGFFDFNNVYSMWLTEENRFYDIQILSWTRNNQGGGFSYLRKEFPGWVSIDDGVESDIFISSGSLSDTESQLITLNIAELRPGIYNADIVIASNDTDESEIVIPITVNVTGGEPALNLSTSSLNFNDVINGTSSSLTLTFLNDGEVDLEVSNITFDNPAFSSATTSLTVPPGLLGVDLEVTFTPDAVAAFTGDLSFDTNDTNDTNNSSGIVSLSGNGIGAPVIAVDNSPISLGTLEIGQTSSFIVNVENTGASELSGQIFVRLSGAQAVTFEKVNNGDPMLEENQDRINDNVWITRGEDQGLFNAATESGFNSSVSPEGTVWSDGRSGNSSLINYENWRNAACPSCVGDFFEFENYYSMRLTETNQFYDVKILSWVQNAAGGGFSYERTEVPGWINVNSDVNIATTLNEDVTFNVETEGFLPGEYTAQIVFQTNDPSTPEVVIDATITLTGTPEIVLGASSIDFSNVFVGSEESRTLTIENIGSDDLVISSITSSNTDFSVSSSSLTIPAYSSEDIDVIVNASIAGALSADLTIASNDAINPSLVVTLDAFAEIAPQIEVAPTMLDVQLFPGESSSDNITISNTATGSINLDWQVVDLSTPSVEQVLDRINANQERLLALVPDPVDLFNFGNDEIRGTPFEDANQIETSSNFSVNYLENSVGSISNFNSYFTRSFGSMFFLAADMIGSDEFGTNGDLLTSEDRVADGFEKSMNFLGSPYKVFFKRIHGGNLSSINHIIFVPDNGTLQRNIDTNTAEDGDLVTGINNDAVRVYFMMFTSANGLFVSNEQLEEIADVYASVILNSSTDLTFGNAPISGVSVDVTSGSLTSGANEITTLSSVADDIPDGNYSFNVYFASNDPDAPVVSLPIDLRIGGIIVSGEVDDVLINEGFGSTNIELAGLFENASGDPSTISYNIVSANEGLVTTSLNSTTLTINEVNGTGTTTISIAASEGISTAFLDFNIRVNAIPDVATELSDVLVQEGFANQDVSLDGVFTDLDNDMLTLSAASDDENVVTQSLMNLTLSLSEAGVGSSLITVTADDGFGGLESETFTIKVNGAPVFQDLPDVMLEGDFVSTVLDFSSLISDPNNDDLVLTAESSDNNVVSIGAITDSSIEFLEAGPGVSTITITADDQSGGMSSATFEFSVEEVVGLADLLNNDLNVYPNPSKDYLILESTGQVDWSIISVTGTIVTSGDLDNGQVKIDLTSIKQGVYYLKLSNEKISKTTRIVVAD